MQLDLNEDQRLIADSASQWLGDHYGFVQRAASLHRDGGSPTAWRAFAEMGWLGLPLPERFGGIDAGPIESGLLMQALGRHLVVEPVQDCVMQAALLLARAGSDEQQRAWLPGVVDGTHRLALVHSEAGDRLPWSRPRTIARRDGEGWRLHGAKRLAISAPGAVRWIVSATVEGVQPEPKVFLVDPRSDGVAVDSYDLLDGGRAADIGFDDVRLDQHAALAVDDAGQRLYRVLAEAVVAQCWQATGAMQAAFEQTTAYVQQRRQFGQALAQFQVVQHRLAEMVVMCTEAQAACELASMRLASDVTAAVDASTTIASMVKNKVARAARFVSQECVQLHGGMGVCEELPIASAFRMLLAFSQMAGDAASHAHSHGRALLASGDFGHSQTLAERRRDEHRSAASGHVSITDAGATA
ncbi:MAG: Acyl-CoA dehydrogenase [Rhizobacter sp.]|nr:Acyl-CoA dehydrogenase [Rhizobacter sp.]